MPTDLADNTAAVAAGYTRIQLDKGAAANPRYMTRYEKPTVGAVGDGGGLTDAEGWSNASQAAADANALAALNGQRRSRYGSSTGVNVSGRGGAMTVDLS